MNILVVDDHEVTRQLLKEVLEKNGYSIWLAASGEDAVKLYRQHKFPIVISDIRMLEMDGMAVLREVKKANLGSVVILMTGFGSMEGAIKAIQEGAFDYISKPFKMNELKAIVARAVKHWESIHDETVGGKAGGASGVKLDPSARGLIGKSPQIVEVYKTLARAAMSSSNVLVIGESGTGKEMVARAIHENSPRRSKYFVPVSCSTISEAQFESETFEDANKGTLFLDEVSDLPMTHQTKLLRVLQDGEFKPVGSSDVKRADIRVIAATQRDLESLVKAGKFREDLFYRLKVISIELPALRERLEDIPDLIDYFLAFYAAKNRKAVSHVSEEAMAILKAYSWPGNVSELEHAIERAVALTNSTILFPEDLPPELTRGEAARKEETVAPVSASSAPEAATASAASTLTEASDTKGTMSSLEEMERAHILKVLQDVHYNKSKASEILGIDRATLYRKAQKYGIDLRGK
jgi:DNA-binding NtrC family response regulator